MPSTFGSCNELLYSEMNITFQKSAKRLFRQRNKFVKIAKLVTFAASNTVDVAQLVRASVCGTEGRGFEPHHLPKALCNKMRRAFAL